MWCGISGQPNFTNMSGYNKLLKRHVWMAGEYNKLLKRHIWITSSIIVVYTFICVFVYPDVYLFIRLMYICTYS